MLPSQNRKYNEITDRWSCSRICIDGAPPPHCAAPNDFNVSCMLAMHYGLKIRFVSFDSKRDSDKLLFPMLDFIEIVVFFLKFVGWMMV